MPPPSKGPLILGMLILAVGVGWLLSVTSSGSGVNWIWPLALAALGVATFILSGGFDKFSVSTGAFFLVASVLSVLRQTGRLSADIELPILVVTIGALLLAVQLPVIPLPRWFGSGGNSGKK